MILQQQQPTMILPQQQPTCEETSLRSLVCAAQNGDRAAYGQLVRRYERMVYATVLRRLSNRAEAQEVCQDVFLQALRKIGQLQDPCCFEGWLRSIAVRMAINRAVRRAPLIPIDSSILEAACVERQTPLASVIIRERENQVHRGLGRLKALDRDTLVAFYFQGQSLLEMSDEFHTPVGTIKRRLHVARKRLAKELQELALA